MTRLVAPLLVVGASCAAAAAGPPAWPQFRGPGGAGIAAGPKPPTRLGPDTDVKWKVAVPPGFSSPSSPATSSS